MLALATLLVIAVGGPRSARAAGGDYAVAGGRVFTQTAGSAAADSAGFLVSDDGGIPFWSEFQNLGGVHVLGYPVTQRFTWNGFTTQAMQKVVFQWRPETARVAFTNVFDELTRAGLDDALAPLLIPPQASFAEDGLAWEEIVRRRTALLDASPPLRDAYAASPDPLRWYGLPTSSVVTYRGVQVVRLQRAALQLWLVDTPWSVAGQVTVANGGDLAKTIGLFPQLASTPRIVGARDDPVIARANDARAAIGLPLLRKSPELMRAAQAHADYYIRNLGDASAGGLHREVPGKPGFSGVSIFDRAKAAAYTFNWIDETFGFLPPSGTLEWALQTVFHRYMFVHPSAVDIGYGSASSGRTTATVFNVGLSPRHTAAVPLPSVFPADGARGVPPAWDGAESPDPAPGVPRPLGPPITLQFGLDDRVSWDEARLLAPSGASVPVVTSISEWRRAIALMPRDPLSPGATYRLHVTGLRNGQAFSFESSFTTRN